MKAVTITFIGCGNMGRSLIGGLIANGHPPKKIRAADIDPAQLKRTQECFPIKISTDNLEAVQKTDVIVLAVKPERTASVAREVALVVKAHSPLVVSIAAGIRMAALERCFNGDAPIVRVMPNTPALVNAGAAALFANQAVSARQREIAESIMRSVGLAIWLKDEAQMDAITALSGSGPAYFFLIMEALEDAAVKLGLPRHTARLLTLQTAFGAAKMALEGGVDAATLRAEVTSPGGTTEQALQVLERGGLRALLTKALEAAHARSIELAKVFGNKS
ncbi:MAG: pyrroline-5-carboxylate reductase [Gammaproteobacteria bacterium]|nr:pyrroline-5-carboxylate reductase [Gammaproteobacteria bacterium]